VACTEAPCYRYCALLNSDCHRSCGSQMSVCTTLSYVYGNGTSRPHNVHTKENSCRNMMTVLFLIEPSGGYCPVNKRKDHNFLCCSPIVNTHDSILNVLNH
jgi:hypothetical protein